MKFGKWHYGGLQDLAKRGRPRKDGERYPSGELKRIGDPTPEHAAQRLAAIGSDHSVSDLGFMNEARAAKRASYPLGILYARGEVSSELHYAGRRYLGLFRCGVDNRIFARSLLGQLVAYGGIGNSIISLYDEADDAGKHRASYLRARDALVSCGAHVAIVVDNLVVYEETDALFRHSVRDLARQGLVALKRHFDLIDGAT